ncbi:MAG: outer membrane protein assembly factor BamE [Smithella sp.]|jgi:outer membrane protein assembly factor BamE (lipoprotein component of BamABCDE complex)
MKKPLTVLLAIFIAGCVSFGRPIDQADLDQIERGVTTKAQVIKLLGDPDKISKNNNITTFIYTHTTSQPGTGTGASSDINYKTQKVTISFNKNDIVTGIINKTIHSSMEFPDNDVLFEHGSIPRQ